MKIKILYFSLILLFVSFALFSNKNDILIQEKTQEDEWDIFNEPEEEQDPVMTNQLFSALVNIKAGAGLINNSLFTQLNVDPLFNVFRFFLEADLKYKVTFFNLLKFESDCHFIPGVSVTSA